MLTGTATEVPRDSGQTRDVAFRAFRARIWSVRFGRVAVAHFDPPRVAVVRQVSRVVSDTSPCVKAPLGSGPHTGATWTRH
jgi:hypothetical protein